MSSIATPTMHLGGRGKPKTTKLVSRSANAGLQFPIGRISRFLKKGRYAQRVGTGSLVYLSVVLKYLATEVAKGKFYALSLQGTLAVIEDIDCDLRITNINTSRAVPSSTTGHLRECLIQSNGEILLIFFIYHKSITMVDQDEVFRLHFPKLAWIKMESLGDRTIFAEPECCIWVTASRVGCRKDCVYFTVRSLVDEWWMYDMRSGCITPHSSKSLGWNAIAEEKCL